MSKWIRVSAFTAVGLVLAVTAFGQDVAGPATTAVKAAQQALKDQGHDPGPIDGVMGPRTEAAIRQFQTRAGLDATGRLDGTTLGKLGVTPALDEAVGASPPTHGARPGRAATADPPAVRPDPDTYQNR